MKLSSDFFSLISTVQRTIVYSNRLVLETKRSGGRRVHLNGFVKKVAMTFVFWLRTQKNGRHTCTREKLLNGNRRASDG